MIPASRSAYYAQIIVLVFTLILAPLSFASAQEDNALVSAGIDAYKKNDSRTAIYKLKMALHKYPETSMRKEALFWLAEALFRNGSTNEAVILMHQFLHDYPNSPLQTTASEELIRLATQNDMPGNTPGRVVTTENLADAKKLQTEIADKERDALDKERLTKLRLEKEEEERLVAAKTKVRGPSPEEKARIDREYLEKKAFIERATADREMAEAAVTHARAEQQELNAQIKALALELATAKADLEKTKAEKAAIEAAAEATARQTLQQERAAAEQTIEKARIERIAIENVRQKAQQDKLAAERASQATAETLRAGAKLKTEIATLQAELVRLKAEKAKTVGEGSPRK